MPGRLLVFGGYGFVGGVIAHSAVLRGWDVAVAGGAFKPGLTNVASISLDITDGAAVRRAVDEFRPHAVVNAAAISDIDRAEREKKLARSVNVEGARNIAETCGRGKISHVFFSSDAVFRGDGHIYTEDDEPAPVNYYGQTKAEAEKAVLAAWPRSAVVRVSLVLGFPVTGGNSFLAGLKKKLAESREIQCPTDEYRTPVDVHTLTEAVLELLAADFSGLLNVGSTDSINRYELAKKAAQMMGFNAGLVTKAKPGAETIARAPRHKNGIIDVTRAMSVLKTKMLSVDESIARAVRGAAGIQRNN